MEGKTEGKLMNLIGTRYSMCSVIAAEAEAKKFVRSEARSVSTINKYAHQLARNHKSYNGPDMQ